MVRKITVVKLEPMHIFALSYIVADWLSQWKYIMTHMSSKYSRMNQWQSFLLLLD